MAPDPWIRVPPKEQTSEPSEAVLVEGESISEFVSRGLRSRDEARSTGDYVDADVVVDGLQRKLDAARARAIRRRK